MRKEKLNKRISLARISNLKIVILDRLSFYQGICQASHLVLIAVSIELSVET